MGLPLALPDAEQCQLGVGRLCHVRRCTNRSAYVITEIRPRRDGGFDTYSVCTTCLPVITERLGPGAFNTVLIED